jgi:protein-S-isoprenylcysteine O-methyltransferase Ste14
VRIPFIRRADRGEIREDRRDLLEGVFNVFSFLGVFVLPFLKLGERASGLTYAPPAWTGWIGTAILAGAIVLVWRAHVDLGRSRSATVRIREGHALVTDGVYAFVRHPIYAAHWLIALGSTILPVCQCLRWSSSTAPHVSRR